MSHICILICQVDDSASDQMTELAVFDLSAPDPTTLRPITALDALESITRETGNAILRRLLQAQWVMLDTTLTEDYRQCFPPEPITLDGQEPITVASRFGILQLSRQVCFHPTLQQHVLPAKAVLPPHRGMIITRGLQEWACLLPQELPFATVARLLGWQTHDADILSDTTIRCLVRTHGQVIRRVEQAEVAAFATQDDLTIHDLHIVPHGHPRRRASWPAELTTAVDAALAAEQVCPPVGVSWADWARVLAARQQKASYGLEELRHLGPELEPNQVLLIVDEVLTPRCKGGRFVELRTARLVTAAGYRYISGVGSAFLQYLHRAVLLALGLLSPLLLIADGARWIRNFFVETLASITRKTMLLDWHHLRQKCLEMTSRICRSREAKRQQLQRLECRLWSGKVAAAIDVLHSYRPEARSEEVLDTFITELQVREAWIPNYRQRRIERKYIGSGHAEKTNDLIVARRQKGRGMHWSQQTSDALAALRTLMLNGGWER